QMLKFVVNQHAPGERNDFKWIGLRPNARHSRRVAEQNVAGLLLIGLEPLFSPGKQGRTLTQVETRAHVALCKPYSGKIGSRGGPLTFRGGGCARRRCDEEC